MKRLTAIFLALTLILSLTACAGKHEHEPETGEPDPNEEPIPGNERSTLKAAVFWYDYFDAYLVPLRERLGEYLTEAGIMFENYDAENTQRTQDGQIDKAIENGAGLLIVNIVDTAWRDSALAICAKAKEADIPVIFFHREVEDSVIKSYDKACYVGFSETDRLRKQGQMAAEYVLENYSDVDLNGDGRISYLLLWGGYSGPEVAPRALYPLYYCDVLLTAAGKPELKYFEQNSSDKFKISDWSADGSFRIMENALGKNPMDGDHPIELVLAGSDNMALGCVKALNNVGWNTGDDPGKAIPVFGLDDTEEAQIAIDEGRMTGTIRLPAEGIAKTVAALAENVQQGRKVFYGFDGYHYISAIEYDHMYDDPDWYKIKTRDEFLARIQVPSETVIKKD